MHVDATPFPHTIVDEFIPARQAALAGDEFPPPDDPSWYTFENDRERKAQRLPKPESECGAIIARLTSSAFVAEVREAFELPDLTPDLHGGGMHQSGRGGLLAMHADFNRHPDGRYRRVNLLLFVGLAWYPEWGGDLVLGEHGDRIISPRPGRLVAFTTSSISWHGHPTPSNCPATVTRKSLAVYLYSSEPPPDFTAPHDTSWLR